MSSRAPPISSEFRGGGGGGLNNPNPPPFGTPLLEGLFIGTSIATKGTLGLPYCEDESSTILGKIFT